MLGNVVKQKRGKGKSAEAKGKGRGRKSSANKGQPQEANVSHRITDYFPVRRSNRKTAKELETEKSLNLEQMIRTGSNEKHLEVYDCKEKGRGIRALRSFERNEFVIEYKGDIINYKEAKIREQEYSNDSKIGSYMYFFKHLEGHFCVDATAESPFKGRLINHSVLKPNLKSKVVDFKNSFHLILIAKRDIEVGEELLYDYGDRTACTIAQNQWLINT